MAVVEQLLRPEADGTISFGNHTLSAKAKLEDFPHGGDLYKVKTYQTMTKLEKNGMFVYESVPGTSVLNFADKTSKFPHKTEKARINPKKRYSPCTLDCTALFDHLSVTTHISENFRRKSSKNFINRKILSRK